jgi:hypothetical protein
MVMALWGTYTRLRIALEPSFSYQNLRGAFLKDLREADRRVKWERVCGCAVADSVG